MRRRSLAFLGLAVSVATAPAMSRATSFTGLGFLPGGGHSIAEAVSDGSVVVGTSAVVGTSGSEAFRWTSSGGMVGLGFATAAANGVSADGSVVVGQEKNNDAFRWTSDGGLVGLGTDLGGSANGVSAHPRRPQSAPAAAGSGG
jgi:hypothetical protein